MSITETTTVAEIAAEFPSSVRVFQQFGIDFCCGGKRPVRMVCEEQGLSFKELEKALDSAAEASTADARDWTHAPLHELIDHIVNTYHKTLRADLPRLEAMAATVASVHGAKSANLARIQDPLGELSEELQQHMWKEEMILFRAIRAIESGAMTSGTGISAPISVMEHEHDHAGQLLAELRRLTDDYVVPEWGCATVRALYQGLAELESSMHVHVHLENNILFPRAVQLAAGANV
jgi:regulator of cell morphogenesis and NO signaling